MTDEQRVRLVRQILEQLMCDELDEAEALRAIDHVRDGAHPQGRPAAATGLRSRDDGGLSPKA